MRSSLILFFFSVAYFIIGFTAFALTPEQAQNLRNEWKVPAAAEDLKSSVVHFLKNSPVIGEIISENAPLSWSELSKILLNDLPDAASLLSEEEFELILLPRKIESEIRISNEYRFDAMELGMGLYKYEKQFMKEVKEKDEKEDRERANKYIEEYKQNIQDEYARIASLLEKNRILDETIQEGERQFDLKLRKNLSSFKSTQERLAHLAEQKKKNALKRPDFNLEKDKISYNKISIKSAQDHIAFLEKQVETFKTIKLSKVTFTTSTNTSLPLLPDGLPSLQLLQGGSFGKSRTLKIYTALGKEFFLTPEYFENLDDEFLNRQAQFAQSALKFIEENLSREKLESEPNELKGVTVQNFLSYIELVRKIKMIHELEIRRRTLLKSTAAKPEPVLKPTEMIESPTIPAAAGSPTPKGKEEKRSAVKPKKTRPLSYPGSKFIVEIKKVVYKFMDSERVSDEQEHSFIELVKYLGEKGPVLKDRSESLGNHWRNFSSLSKLDYHCHIGSSDVVVVWRVVDSKIVIYYLGTHPKYKRVLQSAPKS